MNKETTKKIMRLLYIYIIFHFYILISSLIGVCVCGFFFLLSDRFSGQCVPSTKKKLTNLTNLLEKCSALQWSMQFVIIELHYRKYLYI